MPNSRWTWTAPATISAGALSPPMASTETGSMTAEAMRSLLDVDGLAAAVPAAVGAHHVGQLGLAALRADAAGRGRQGPVRGAPAAALGFGGLLLRDGHGRLSSVVESSVVVGTQRVQRCPSGITRHHGVPAVALVAIGPALGAEALAVLAAEGRQGQLEQYSVARQRRQVDLVAAKRIGLLAVAPLLVQLSGVGVELTGHGTQAAAAVADPAGADVGDDQDVGAGRLQSGVHEDVSIIP